MKKTKRVISMIMIFLIIVNTGLPNLARASDPKTIHISSARDLIQLSEDCSFDGFSQGIKVFLDKDIDLEDKAFLPIPIFAGTFDGQGHRIQGLNIEVEGSDQGFFRYLEKEGIVKNLNLEAGIKPLGDKAIIGGLVGNNKGLIDNCSFSGLVNGKDFVGGLVGWNSSSGRIINSSSQGIVYGEYKVGGIAGYNAGTISRSSNYSSVNTTVEDHKIGLSDLTMDNINFSKLFIDARDIGGITGVNTGVVQSCENHGIVGYPHVGYNIGGIAGRQSGYISKSSNYESVYGRKEVAGIAGQIEPHFSTIIGSSKLKGLQEELDALDASILNMMNGMKGFSQSLNENMLSIQGDIEKSKDHIQSLMEQNESIIDKGMEELDKISIIALEILDSLSPIEEKVLKLIETMEDAKASIEQSIEEISKIIEDSPELTEKTKELFISLEESMTRILESEEKLKEVYEDIEKLVDLLLEGQVEGLDILLESIFDNFQDLGNLFNEEISKIQAIFQELIKILESMEDEDGFIDNSLESIKDGIKIMESMADDIGGIFKDIENLFNFIREQDEIEFEINDDLYEKTQEDLYGSINDISSSLSIFMKEINIEGNKMIDHMQAVMDQLFKTINAMIGIIEEISGGEISQDDIVKDISQDDIERKTEGKVSDCKNKGKIEGDLNVGGIAGGMSIELPDPELDLELKGKLSYNTIFESRAIVLRCENTGPIVSKKDNVGGIVGSMDLGYLRDCSVASTVTSEDGNYLGGIAGKSQAPIVSSYSRTILDGKNYIGGIAGFGKEIKNSYSLPKINSSKAYLGAIAGKVDEKNNIKANYFVSQELRGIDGISYKDRAEAISYEELRAKENLPNIFRDFKLSFWVNDKLFKKINLNYGDLISEKNFPDLPKKEGYYGRWEDIDGENLLADMDIHASYAPYLTIIESQEKRDGLLPIVLVEGLFVEEDSLILKKDKTQGPSLENEPSKREQWKLIIPEDGESTHKIRYLPQEEKNNLRVYVLRDGKWEKTKAKWDGKYLVFQRDENEIVFSIVDAGTSYVKYISILIGTALILLLIKMKRRKKYEKKEDMD